VNFLQWLINFPFKMRRLASQDGNLHMVVSTSGIHGTSTERVGLRWEAAHIALELSMVA
jgi:hypothetical protein